MSTWKTLLLSAVILAAAGTAIAIMMNQTPEPEKAEATETEWRIESTRVEAGFYQPQIRLVGQEQAIGAYLTQGERQTELHFDRAQAQMTASQSGFAAWFDLTDSTGWLPGGYARVTLQLPPRFSYRVPEAAVFQDGWVYRIRLQAEAVEILGINQADNSRWLIVQGPDLAGDLRLLTTRLANPMTGMRVHEPGVDPDPDPAVDGNTDQPMGVNP